MNDIIWRDDWVSMPMFTKRVLPVAQKCKQKCPKFIKPKVPEKRRERKTKQEEKDVAQNVAKHIVGWEHRIIMKHTRFVCSTRMRRKTFLTSTKDWSPKRQKDVFRETSYYFVVVAVVLFLLAWTPRAAAAPRASPVRRLFFHLMRAAYARTQKRTHAHAHAWSVSSPRTHACHATSRHTSPRELLTLSPRHQRCWITTMARARDLRAAKENEWGGSQEKMNTPRWKNAKRTSRIDIMPWRMTKNHEYNTTTMTPMANARHAVRRN